MSHSQAAEDAFDSLNMVISAAEAWGGAYAKTPEQHAKLIKLEGKMSRAVRRHFKDLAKNRIHKYVNWANYHIEKIKAADINPIFNGDDFEDDESGLMLTVLHDPLLDGAGIGMAAGQEHYSRDLGMSSTSVEAMKWAQKYSSTLVEGISKTTANKIRQSISSSLSLGETDQEAAARLAGVIDDPARALTIARTESVSSYNQGLMLFGDQSGAVGKEWDDVGAEDECATNTSDGEIGFGDSFSSGDDAPPAHPNCRCSMYLTYPDATTSEEDSGE